jgi:hypothetical protein
LTEEEFIKAQQMVVDFDYWYYGVITDDERVYVEYSEELYKRLREENLLGIDFRFVSLDVR